MRYAWCMALRPGMAKEYKRRHDEIWPEMKALLHEAGYRDYAIFLHDNQVFGTFATDDFDALLLTVARSPVAARWRAYMADVIDNRPDPATGHQPFLELQFYQP